MKARRVHVPVPGNGYDVHVGRGLLKALPRLLSEVSREKRAVLVTDSLLAESHAREARRLLRAAGWDAPTAVLPRGEAAKSFRSLERLYGFFLKHGVQRRTPVAAIGGGTVGDAAGFAAATYYRGVPLVHVPTTLLAQVDSAIGGKTAVNHPLAKNAVGAFYQPRFVLCDVDVLKTLPRRDVLSGLAETVKYALVFDSVFARWLERNWTALLRKDSAALMHAVAASARWKGRVVAADAHDMSGRRELLNFGHTAGHALEAATGFRVFRHGEAVAWGMRAALALSRNRGWMAGADSRLAEWLLHKLAPPSWPRRVTFRHISSHLHYDKKRRGSRNIFILLRGIGRPVRVDDVSLAELRRALASLGVS